MADTYTQLYIHIVFFVKGRQPLIPKQHKTELHKYITGIITNKKQKMIQMLHLIPDPHCAPLERRDWSDGRSIDMPPRWGENLNKSTDPKYVFDADAASDP